MSKAEDLSRQYVLPFLDEIYEVYGEHRQMQLSKFDGYDIMSAYEEGYHQAEKDLTDKAKVSSGWDGFFYGQGYKQAKKDLELTWEDMRELYIIFAEIDVDIDFYKTDIKSETIGYYQEVLKRFKERKGL